MNPLQACKFVNALPAISVGAAAYTVTAVDCRGYHYATVIASFGAMSANDFTVMNITASNDDSTYGAITSGSVFSLTTSIPAAGVSTTDTTSMLDAATGITGTTPNNDDDKIYVWHIDLRKATFSGATGATAGNGVRYLKPAISPGGTTVGSIIVILSAADPGLVTATNHGAEVMCIV